MFKLVINLGLAGMALAAYAVWGPAPATVWRQLETISPVAWLLAVIGLGASYCFRATRLYAEWHPLNGVGWQECLRVAVFHTVAINLLPMRSGEASYPLMLKHRWKVPLLRASLSLLWMRTQDISVVAVFTLFAFMPGPWPTKLLATTMVVLVVALGGKLLLPRMRVSFVGWPTARRDTSGSRLRWRDFAGKLASASVESRGGGRAWGCCVTAWVLKFSTLMALFSQLAGLPLAAALCGVLGGEFASALPVQPAMGAGTYEAGVLFGAAAGRADAMPDNATLISAAIAMHVFMLSMSAATATLLFVTGFSERSGLPNRI